MEQTFTDENYSTFPRWHWIERNTTWNGQEVVWGYGDYLKYWFISNKSHFFMDFVQGNLNSLNAEQLDKLNHAYFYSLEKECNSLTDLLKMFLIKDRRKFHKTILMENRGHILVYVEKNHGKLFVSFFSKNFNQESFLLKLWNEKKQRFILKNEGQYSFDKFTNFLKKLQDFQQNISIPNDLTQIELKTHQFELPNIVNPNCSPTNNEEVSNEIKLRTTAYARVLTKLIGEYKKSFFESLTDFGLGLVSEYDALRIHLLKFLAILPCLEHDKNGNEVKRLFLESLMLLSNDNKNNCSKKLPIYLRLIVPFAIIFSRFCPSLILSFLLRKSAGFMAKRFIAGENIQSSFKTLEELGKTAREATLDQLGELVLCQEEADQYLRKVLDLIEGLKTFYKPGERNAAGILKAHVSVKTTALGEQLKPHAYEDCFKKISPRLTKILKAAKEANVFINIDAEHYHYRDIVWKIYSHILKSDVDLYRWKDTGIVVQAYLTDGIDHLMEILEFQNERKILMPIRLVKGAYWDAETIEAKAHSFEPPQFLNKIETDIHFRQLSYKILSCPYTQLVIASHNVMDHCYAESLRTTLFPRSYVIEHQCLHMTYEALSVSLAKMGYVVRNYMPVGNLLVGMAYLVRRIMENSSQVGVLKMMRSVKQIDFNQNIFKEWEDARSHNWRFSDHEKISSGEFQNHSPVRVYEKGQAEHIENVRKYFSQVWSKSGVIVDIEETPTVEVSNLMSQLHNSWFESDWRHNELKRALTLLQSCELMIIFRDEISQTIMHESHKSILEAYADVDEAIDFVNFYVRNYFDDPSLENCRSLGVVAAITPWNFPFAIPAGMCVAPLIAGNAVILKSAEQTPQVAQVLTMILYLSGISPSIFKHAIGKGETVGHAITLSGDLHGLVFTGSTTVGTMLYRELSSDLVKNKNGEIFPRVVITEMGGKNPIIVTQNAELDETISGVLYSAFAHAGQKCSACSRIIVDKNILEPFKKRLLSSISSVNVGHAFDPAVLINPVISEEDKQRLINFKKLSSEEAMREGGKVLLDLQSSKNPNEIGPVVIEVPFDLAIRNDSFAQKEAFGPIIHLIAFDSLENAVFLANATPYALTAGLYSQSPSDIDYFCKNIQCGNIYVNRPNTGARVGIEPFGGFKLSGTGPKAGGISYVKSFALPSIFQFKNDKKNHQNVIPWSQKTSEHLKSIFPLPKPKFHDFKFYDFNDFKELDEFITIEDIGINISKEQNYDFCFKANNTNCPGQQSYSLFTKPINLAIYVDVGVEKSFFDRLFLKQVLKYQIPLVIAVASKEKEQSWEKTLIKIEKLGHPKDKIVLWSSSMDVLFKEFSNLKMVDLFWIAADQIEHYSNLVHSLKRSYSYSCNLPAIFSQYSPNISYLFQKNEFEKILFNERSYAINIMRHGAPLD